MRKRIKCFEEVLDRKRNYSIMDAGLRVVEVNRITGTVDKCGELDGNFHYLKRRDRSERSRRYRITQAVQEYHFLPPIDVYLYKGEYYVVDGNRRVATAKTMGIDFIDANVIEYIDKDDVLGMNGALSRRRFENETGLKNIVLAYEKGYGVLLEEARNYSGVENLEARLRKWYSDVFLPACMLIEKSILPQKYKKLQTGDLYVLLVEFYRKFMGSLPQDAGFDTLISGFIFAHSIPQRRFFRILPFRVISTLLLGRRRHQKKD